MIDDPLHARSILPAGELSPLERSDKAEKLSGGESGEASFLHVLKDSMEKVNQMQNEADKTIQDFSTGQDGVTLHQTMVAMSQADVSFQLMMQVRDRIVRAYQDVMNMPM
ncbi:MAG: flagellar hook-basal body complex protein FliE [Nitrospirae bacterium]|jgi:flagellar hook-basal body complex protein FliE|nr:flagellar hook-basal body complex protein FliE [Nitrospirota bacterium]